MAFLERIRLTFFDLKSNIEDGKLAELLGNARVTSSSNGYGQIVLGDSTGRIHLIRKMFEIKTFEAYNQCVTLVEQCKQLPYLITIGEDGIGINPHIRIWHTEKLDKNDQPVCLRVTRVSIPNKVVIPTAICVSDNMTIMAVGFNDGSILIYRGDVKKERSSKQTLLTEYYLSSVTGLSLSAFGKTVHLYVATVNSIEMIDISQKDKEKIEDEKGKHFFVARDKAVYCYTNGVLGPCYAVNGTKLQLSWFRSYLVIISEEINPFNILGSQPSKIRDEPQRGTHVITILDTKNNVTAYHSQVHDVQDVLMEWGSLYILSPENQLSMVAEKDIHSKLALLFKKNLYDVAIRVAKYHQYDSDSLMEISRQYGDHLYSKGDHKGAIEQYIRTIGKLEPSYVIRKYLGSQQVENLTTYLQALHKQGVASGEHTTLLLNFYTKLNKPELLKEFIMTKDRQIDFDVEVAIDVCRHVSPEDALLLAEKHKKHDWYLSIQIDDLNKYNAGLDYIAKLEFNDAHYLIRKYGSTLLAHIPEETTQFLIKLCTCYRPSTEPTLDELDANGYDSNSTRKANPESFIHYFLDDSVRLVEFLEKTTESGSGCNSQVYTTLLEHYLQVWASQIDTSSKLAYESKIMKLLETPEEACDKHQALVLCKAANFPKGLLFLYGQNKMYQSISKYHVQENDHASLLGCCRRFEHQMPSLWLQALWELKFHKNLKEEVLHEILMAIEKRNLMSPIIVIDSLSDSSCFLAGHLKSYLKSVLQRELKLKEEQDRLISDYEEEIVETQRLVDDLMSKPVKFQVSRILSINNAFKALRITITSVLHAPKSNKLVIDSIRSQEENKNLDEVFHGQLEQAEDGFSLVTDFLGIGVFTRLTNYRQVAMRADTLRTKMYTKPSSNVNTTTEQASQPSQQQRIINRNEELLMATSYKNSRIGGDMKTLDSQLATYGTSIKSAQPGGRHSADNPPASERITTSAIGPAKSSGNPFEDDDEEDDVNNPFNTMDEESHTGKNPFGNEADDEFEESDDYDKNLNPFA
ncbi:RING [Nesidiocoris tenuis]|uniref:Vacuolar protein sorting-associated protein 11 homolog n=2 Tax=Nesidiocoris tenuis TaxID=355587 RepID=A0ABN7A7U0_9HEMI|nr:RING [Nesidiocoris tenuis]